MSITFNSPKHHWNYFLSIDADLEDVARYIEFDKDNLKTFSIELTRIFISASAEIDVVLKLICKEINPESKAERISEYRNEILGYNNFMKDQYINIYPYNLFFKPWEQWNCATKTNPDWWGSYNHVKHNRNEHYKEANLENTINAVGALLIAIFYYYFLVILKEKREKGEKEESVAMTDVFIKLGSWDTFVEMNSDYYPLRVI